MVLQIEGSGTGRLAQADRAGQQLTRTSTLTVFSAGHCLLQVWSFSCPLFSALSGVEGIAGLFADVVVHTKAAKSARTNSEVNRRTMVDLLIANRPVFQSAARALVRLKPHLRRCTLRFSSRALLASPMVSCDLKKQKRAPDGSDAQN